MRDSGAKRQEREGAWGAEKVGVDVDGSGTESGRGRGGLLQGAGAIGKGAGNARTGWGGAGGGWRWCGRGTEKRGSGRGVCSWPAHAAPSVHTTPHDVANTHRPFHSFYASARDPGLEATQSRVMTAISSRTPRNAPGLRICTARHSTISPAESNRRLNPSPVPPSIAHLP